jgi:hypothetical protein
MWALPNRGAECGITTSATSWALTASPRPSGASPPGSFTAFVPRCGQLSGSSVPPAHAGRERLLRRQAQALLTRSRSSARYAAPPDAAPGPRVRHLPRSSCASASPRLKDVNRANHVEDREKDSHPSSQIEHPSPGCSSSTRGKAHSGRRIGRLNALQGSHPWTADDTWRAILTGWHISLHASDPAPSAYQAMIRAGSICSPEVPMHVR